MFFLIVMSIWTVLHAYVFWRAASVPEIHRRVARKWIFCVAVSAWCSYLIAQWIEPFAPARLVWVSQLVTADWLGILFLLSKFTNIPYLGAGCRLRESGSSLVVQISSL